MSFYSTTSRDIFTKFEIFFVKTVKTKTRQKRWKEKLKDGCFTQIISQVHRIKYIIFLNKKDYKIVYFNFIDRKVLYRKFNISIFIESVQSILTIALFCWQSHPVIELHPCIFIN